MQIDVYIKKTGQRWVVREVETADTIAAFSIHFFSLDAVKAWLSTHLRFRLTEVESEVKS